LHGVALTAHTWDLCCLALRDEFHCIALDQRGHGDTDWAPDADYSIAAQREDVKGFVDELGLDRFILAGMSMGAINALAFAIHYPERLSHLVVIDAGPEVRRPGSRRIRDFVNGGVNPEPLESIIERALAGRPLCYDSEGRAHRAGRQSEGPRSGDTQIPRRVAPRSYLRTGSKTLRL